MVTAVAHTLPVAAADGLAWNLKERDIRMKFDGSVLVTGASQGLGLALTQELSRHHVRVVAGVVDEEAHAATVDQVDASVDVRVLDVTKPASFEVPSDLSVLINNAGVRPQNLPVEHLQMEEWRRTFSVNLFGTVETCRRAIPILRSRGGGTICNIGSASLFEPTPFLAAYRASKAALAALDDALRIEVAPFNIKVLEPMPRATATPMNDESYTRRMVPAVDYPEYEDLALRLHGIASNNTTAPTPVGAAARRIVDAIEEVGDHLRVGTDATAQRRLEHWRLSSDEAIASEVASRLSDIDVTEVPATPHH